MHYARKQAPRSYKFLTIFLRKYVNQPMSHKFFEEGEVILNHISMSFRIN